MPRLLWNVWMFLQFYSVKYKQRWHLGSGSVRFFTDRVRFGSDFCTFLLSSSSSVRFLAKLGLWFGSFLLGSRSFLSLLFTDLTCLHKVHINSISNSKRLTALSTVMLMYPITLAKTTSALVRAPIALTKAEFYSNDPTGWETSRYRNLSLP